MRVFLSRDRVNNVTAKLDRIMESVLEIPGPDDNEGRPAVTQPVPEWRPPTREFGGLERRLGRMEQNLTQVAETVKTILDLMSNQKVLRSQFTRIIFA